MSSYPKDDGEDENDYVPEHHHRHRRIDHPEERGMVNDDDDPARDFMPPRSYVRRRQQQPQQQQVPIFHSPTYTGNREVDEGLAAYKAVSDQLSRSATTWQRTAGGRGGNDRRPVHSKVR